MNWELDPEESIIIRAGQLLTVKFITDPRKDVACRKADPKTKLAL
jgi:hypothetical protein